ncbi:MAG: hypothetical protein QW091_02735 [Candidatus Micrarchaeaceae archaeon]
MAKWNVRYGASLRKRYLAVVSQKKGVYVCDVCGKKAVKRIGSNIWQCKSCGATFAGGAFTPSTEAGRNAQRVLGVAKIHAETEASGNDKMQLQEQAQTQSK